MFASPVVGKESTKEQFLGISRTGPSEKLHRLGSCASMDNIHMQTASEKDIRKLPNIDEITARKILELTENETLTYHKLATISKMPENQWQDWCKKGRVTRAEQVSPDSDLEMDTPTGQATEIFSDGDREETTVVVDMLSQPSALTDDQDRPAHQTRLEHDLTSHVNNSYISNGITNEELRHKTMLRFNNVEVHMSEIEERNRQWRREMEEDLNNWMLEMEEKDQKRRREMEEKDQKRRMEMEEEEQKRRKEEEANRKVILDRCFRKFETQFTEVEGRMEHRWKQTSHEISKLSVGMDSLKDQLYRGLGDMQGELNQKCEQMYRDIDVKLSEHHRQCRQSGKPHSDELVPPPTWRQSSAEESGDHTDTESATSAKASINKSYRELDLGMNTLNISSSSAKDHLATSEVMPFPTKATEPEDREVETSVPCHQSTGRMGAKMPDSPLPPSQRGIPVEFQKITKLIPANLVYQPGQRLTAGDAVGRRTGPKEKAGCSQKDKRDDGKLTGQQGETPRKVRQQASVCRLKLHSSRPIGPLFNISEGAVSSLVGDDTIAGTAFVGAAEEERTSKPLPLSVPQRGIRDTSLDMAPENHRRPSRTSGQTSETLQLYYKGSPNPPEDLGMTGNRTDHYKGSPNPPDNLGVRGSRTDRLDRDTPYQEGKEMYQLGCGTEGQVYQKRVRQQIAASGQVPYPEGIQSSGYVQYPPNPPRGYGDLPTMQSVHQPPGYELASLQTRHPGNMSTGHCLPHSSLQPGRSQMSGLVHPGFATGNSGGYPQLHDGVPYKSVPGQAQTGIPLMRTPLRPPTAVYRRPSARRLTFPEHRCEESDSASESSESEYSSSERRNLLRRSKSGSSIGRARFPSPKMPQFSGAIGEWDNFLFQFENICEYYRLDKGNKLQQLKSCLSGNAVKFVRTLSERCTSSYRRLCSRLRDRFAGTERPEVLRNMIPDLKQRVDESVEEFADRIQTQTNLAFPECPQEYVDWSAKNGFIRGARDRPAVLEAIKTNPQTMRQLISAMKDHTALVKVIMGKSSYPATRQVSFIGEEPMVRQTSFHRQHTTPAPPPPRRQAMETKGMQAGVLSGSDRYRFPSSSIWSPTQEYPSSRSPTGSPSGGARLAATYM